jgi:hypothetical protein
MAGKYKILIILTLSALLLTTTVLAAGDYEIPWWTIDNGGGVSQSANGQYVLQGTVGQADTGISSGDGYSISSGFWHGVVAALREFWLYLPFINP